uniref:Uncharacterized protein n=1 Tax=Red panda feces-associated crucivirus TaxID=2864022 RepID=A0A8K1M3Q3_9VIRU|nr:hypothetical protein 4 [Red panda feces-associated crucivirus]
MQDAFHGQLVKYGDEWITTDEFSRRIQARRAEIDANYQARLDYIKTLPVWDGTGPKRRLGTYQPRPGYHPIWPRHTIANIQMRERFRHRYLEALDKRERLKYQRMRAAINTPLVITRYPSGRVQQILTRSPQQIALRREEARRRKRFREYAHPTNIAARRAAAQAKLASSGKARFRR